MKTFYKSTLLAGLFLSLFGYNACSPGFKVQSVSNISEVTSMNQLSQSDFSLESSRGSLKWYSQPTLNNQDYKISMKVPYGKVFKGISKMIKSSAKYSCAMVPDVLKDGSFSYNSEEIPCGAIVDQNWKLLMYYNIDAASGSTSGLNYSFTGFQLPLFLSRETYSGKYTESDLTKKSIIEKQSSKKYLDDISIRYTPAGNQSKIELCINLPGGRLASVSQRVYGKIWDKILGFKVSYASAFDIYPGEVQYDYVRGCFAADVGFVGFDPKINIHTTQVPAVHQATYQGVHIQIKDTFLRIIDNILNIFKLSIRKIAQKSITDAGNKILDQDIESGVWFSKVHGEQVLQDLGTKISNSSSSYLRTIGVPASDSDFKQFLKDTCLIKKLSGDSIWNSRLQKFCDEVVDRIQIQVTPFTINPDENQAGCYQYFARVHESSGSWWEQGCHFQSDLNIHLQLQDIDFVSEAKLLLAERWKEQFIPDVWKDKIEELGIDEMTFFIILKQAQSLGINTVSAQDIERLLGQFLVTP